MQKFYNTTAWRTLRAKVRRQARLSGASCHFCGEPLDWTKPHAVSIDHIVNRKARPDLALTLSNLAAVCHTCNSKKAAWLEKTGGTPQIGADGFPVDSDWGHH